jgi:hypothetical protein
LRIKKISRELCEPCVDLCTAEREMTEVHTGTGNSPLRKPQFLNRFFANSEERGGGFSEKGGNVLFLPNPSFSKSSLVGLGKRR